ncbi:aromatic acid exporter family protein [Ammoniphilus sp. 3BR4]|uniref:FUSC family protein n=1 Tax=Ammoniphilus sp. 3BR4 TaxID=3158265 RepID=UPI0034676E34
MNKWFGKRIMKTAIAVFITAWVCQQLGWPVIFAVITAIVTIEPTLSSSIKKGMIRLPAAAMGAAFALFFDYLFGQIPLTYALSAALTIYMCHLFRWHDAMIVATLTAAAMIPITDGHFFEAFYTRIGTTSIGIILSSIVNFVVWPPDFSNNIETSCRRLSAQSQKLFEEVSGEEAKDGSNRKLLKQRLSAMMKELNKTYELIHHQKQGYRYQKHNESQINQLIVYEETLEKLEEVLFQTGYLLSASKERRDITTRNA